MTKPIAIYGAGGFGRETALLVQQINAANPQWDFLGFFDDGLPRGSRVGDALVLGGIEDALASDVENLALAIADGGIRSKLFETLKWKGFRFPTLIHPSVNLGSTRNRIGQGCLISAGSIFTSDVVVDEFVIINLAVTIGHDVHLHSFSSVMPACHLSGNVIVKSGAYLGTGAKILQGVTIGEATKVGAGSVVLHNVPAGVTAVGVPARIIEK
ncbi:MAG: acetyltransferase [Cyclobacteriaceae bacterium]|jgi:sugar O-acyltransferase (sialic acid O-acetyltransferase NeuD family)